MSENKANIRLVTLVSGHSFITDMQTKGKNSTSVILKKPAIHQAMPDPNNPEQVSLMLIPYHPLVEHGDIEVSKEHILFTAKLDEDIENHYREKFGSGLKLPEKKQIIV